MRISGCFLGAPSRLATCVLVGVMTIWAAPSPGADEEAITHYKRGRLLREQKDLDGAIVEYKKAIAIDPDYGDAHYSLGYAYHLKAAQMNPVAPRRLDEAHPVQTYVKKWERGIREMELAIAEFKKVVELQPKAPDAYFKLALVYDNKGDYKEACDEYRRVIELDPRGLDGQDARANLALIQFAIYGNRDEAVQLLRAVLGINPNHASATSNLQLMEGTQK